MKDGGGSQAKNCTPEIQNKWPDIQVVGDIQYSELGWVNKRYKGEWIYYLLEKIFEVFVNLDESLIFLLNFFWKFFYIIYKTIKFLDCLKLLFEASKQG